MSDNTKLINNIEIRPAGIEQEPIFANLLEMYSHDFSEVWKFDLGDDGFYGYEGLSSFWQEPKKFPFLIYVDGKIAGLVLVQQGSPIEDDPQIWDIAEFFILRKYRKQGIGTNIAHLVWQQFAGRWQVRVLQGNTMARAFWVHAIEKFAGHGITPIVVKGKSDEAWDIWDVFKFDAK